MELARTIYNPKTKIWHGRHIPLVYHPNVSLAQIIFNVLSRNPNRVVQISDDSGIEVTTEEIKLRSIRASLHMHKLNLTNDDCIGIVASNNHHLAPIIVAALLIGVPFHSLDPSIDSADISHHFNLSKPKIIFCDHNVLDRVKAASSKIGLNPILVTFDEKLDGVRFVEEYFEPISDENDFIPIQIENGEKSIAIILCSSGTTGLSKAICLSHAQVVDKFTEPLKQTFDDVFLCFSTVYWISGIMSLLCGLYNGCTRIITRNRFTPEIFFKIVQKYRVTQFIGPPSQYGLLYQHPDIQSTDLSSLKDLHCGGSLTPEEYAAKAKKNFRNATFNTCYGLSEVSGIVTFNCAGDGKHVGSVFPNTKMKIVDDNGNNLNINENGEIAIRTNFRFIGYKGDPELSKKTVGTDGWVYTGDIGHFDENGFLYIVDRKKDTFKYRGFVISPWEIEQYLLTQVFLENVCVVGIPDKILGELPAAVIVKSEHFKSSQKDESIKETVYNLVRDNLVDYKLLRGGLYIVEELPMTPSGKIVRRQVLRMAVELYNERK